MWDFAKALIGFSWAMSLFGVQQLANIMTPAKAARAFRDLTLATEAGLSSDLKAAFRAGHNLQKSFLDHTHGNSQSFKSVPAPPASASGFAPGDAAGKNVQPHSSPLTPPEMDPDGRVPIAQVPPAGWGPMPASRAAEAVQTPAQSDKVGWGPMPA